MKHIRGVLLLAVVLAMPMALGGQVSAASEQSVQELRVTAKVPHRRDIVIDHGGNITQIVSNTKQDVTPSVYLGAINSGNKKPLTDRVYKQYRKHVPKGTAEYGMLYQRGIPLSILKPTNMSLSGANKS